MTRAGSMRVLVFAVTAAGSACAGSRGAQASRPAQPAEAPSQAEAHASGSGRMGTMMQCPMAVPGTQVAAADTPNGESVTFTTSPEGVPDLRARVHAMADMYERHHESGGMGMHGPGMGEGSAGSGDGSKGPTTMQMTPPSRAVVEDVDGGARVTVTPNDPDDLEQLRSMIRANVGQMRDTGTCAMDPGAMQQQR